VTLDLQFRIVGMVKETPSGKLLIFENSRLYFTLSVCRSTGTQL
jgi:hypothetical protein